MLLIKVETAVYCIRMQLQRFDKKAECTNILRDRGKCGGIRRRIFRRINECLYRCLRMRNRQRGVVLIEYRKRTSNLMQDGGNVR